MIRYAFCLYLLLKASVIKSSPMQHITNLCLILIQDGLDGSVLAENLFELKNGCICCTVKDDLVTTLETLLTRRSKFDYVIIETTGLANPVCVPHLLFYAFTL
jgi:CobW/HypB/UreG, nucleotide-binding domain